MGCADEAARKKNYGSIPHLPNSRMGPADHACHEGQYRIACEKARDKHDLIIVTEKLDGSNVGICRVGDDIHAIGRAGYLAQSSKYEQHQLFAAWVRADEEKWRAALQPGERLCGEWMAQAHGSQYTLPQGPFAAFDLIIEEKRAPFADLVLRCKSFGVPMPKVVHVGEPITVEKAMELLGQGEHGCVGEPEGCVWRVERRGEYDFLAKWVRPSKIDGSLLPEMSGASPVWNWRPQAEAA